VTTADQLGTLDLPPGSLSSGAQVIAQPLRVFAFDPLYLAHYPMVRVTGGTYAPGTVLISPETARGLGVGPGGTVLGLFTQHGSALPIAAAQADLAAWHGRDGTAVPLGALPVDLVLRGTDGTSVPSSGVSLLSVAPTRASTTQTTLITLQGSGFIAGPTLAVRFVPVASPSGAFQGLNATVVNGSAITVKVPAGAMVQDYVVEVTNGDGAAATFHTAFTVTP
jgi:hypothetical protein